MHDLDKMIAGLDRVGVAYKCEAADVDDSYGTEVRVGTTAYWFNSDGSFHEKDEIGRIVWFENGRSEPELTIPQYVEGAISTEQIDFDGIRERMTPDNIGLLLKALRVFAKVAEHIEQLKKVFIYGKDPEGYLEPLDVNLFDHITPEQVENTREAVKDDQVLRLLHGILGTSSEAGELATAVLAHLREAFGLDWTNLIEEVGDNQWYIAIISDVIGVKHGQRGTGHSLLDALHKNREKLLDIRYKDGFTEEAALNRDTDAERKALEGGDE